MDTLLKKNNSHKIFLTYDKDEKYNLSVNNRVFNLIKDESYWYIKHYNKVITKSHIDNCIILSVPPPRGWENNNIINEKILENIIKYNSKFVFSGVFNKWSIAKHKTFLIKSKKYILNIFLIFNRIETRDNIRMPPELILMILNKIIQFDMLY
jgi:hypothetical protein